MLGISVYFQDLDEDYIRLAHSFGAKLIFTSLHIPEEDLSEITVKLKLLLSLCKQLDLDLLPDISPLTFEKLNLANNDFQGLKALGFKKVRLDFGFDDLEIVKEISQYFEILINASTINQDYLLSLADIGVDISKFTLSHNFYPKANTALSDERLLEINNSFKSLNLRTQAFVAGDKLRRFPIYEGLPTLESQRYLNPYVAYVDLKRRFEIDDIIVGDTFASSEALKFIYNYENKNIITIKAHLNSDYAYLYHKELKIRSDISDSSIRIDSVRSKDVKITNNTTRHFGSIGIDNYLYGRYSGEISIYTKDLAADARVNNIGFVAYDYLGLLYLIRGSDKIMFLPL